ncbi:MAG: response regulator transcription factor [Candidatus Nanopelagicales bacterium]
MSHILLVEDEARIASFVDKGLRAQGYTVSVVDRGLVALEAASRGQIDLIILDIGLPDIDGFTVLAQLRAGGDRVPVIILTARDSATDTVAGLEGGADDYMAKPFSFAELAARIRLRLATRSAQPDPETLLQVGPIQLDQRSRVAQVGGRSLELSAREFALLETFLRSPGQVLTREVLLDRVWGYSFDPGSNIVDVYVRYLRRKLGAEAIETVRGAGYRLAVNPRGQ